LTRPPSRRAIAAGLAAWLWLPPVIPALPCASIEAEAGREGLQRGVVGAELQFFQPRPSRLPHGECVHGSLVEQIGMGTGAHEV
jgi:hypothetical protein